MHRCVPLEKLWNFAAALLSPNERRAIRDHVQTCPTCQTRLTQIEETIQFVVRYEPDVSVRVPPRLHRQLLSMIPVPADQKAMKGLSDVSVLTKKIRRVVAQWIGPAVSQPLLARAQSAMERSRTHLYRAEDVEIILALKQQGGDQWAIVGEVFSREGKRQRLETEDWKPGKGGEDKPQASSPTPQEKEISGDVTLRALDGSAQQAVGAEGSAFLFDTVKRGTYALEIPCGDRRIEIESLNVGE